MPDVVELAAGPPAADQTGNLTIWWVPTIADVNAPKLTEIAAGKRITYSFIAGGWNITQPQERLDDERLTSPQKGQALGKTSPALDDLKYVESTDAGSAAVVLKPVSGLSMAGYFVERRGIAQSVVGTVGDKVRVIDCSVGIQTPGETQGQGKFTLVQAVSVRQIVGPVALV